MTVLRMTENKKGGENGGGTVWTDDTVLIK